MFDPLLMTEKIKRIVCFDKKRKYYRFRPAKFYGGIATADCVGCNLRCIFCWAWNVVTKPENYGKYYSPEDVAKKLVEIASEKRLEKVRISGNEPTLCKEHLISVLEKLESLNSNLLFILETNGILLGAEEEYSKELSSFRNLHVRVSFKAADEKRFSELTGASEKGFEFQLKALKNLEKYKVSCHPSLMISFSEPTKIESFRDTLRKISKRFEEFEIEEVMLYPEVLKRLKEKKYSWLK